MKFKILILLPFFFFNFLFSQTKETEKNKWTVKINALQIIDVFSFPTLQLSLERKINEKMSINAEYGFQLYDVQTRLLDSITKEEKGFKANIEARYYINKNKHVGVYTGLQAFYRENQTSSFIRYRNLVDLDSPKTFSDVYDVKKQSYGINSIFGIQVFVGKKIVAEPFLGIGIMNRQIDNDNIEFNSTIHESLENHKFIPSLENQSGWDLNLCFGFRVGYKL